MVPLLSIWGPVIARDSELNALMTTDSGFCTQIAPIVPPITMMKAVSCIIEPTCPPSSIWPPTMEPNASTSPSMVAISIRHRPHECGEIRRYWFLIGGFMFQVSGFKFSDNMNLETSNSPLRLELETWNLKPETMQPYLNPN